MRILVVDDEPDVLRSISLSLKLQEPLWEIITASNGEEAISIVEDAAPDLVLLDVLMPGMDGISVLKRIRKFSDVPVILVTVRDEEVDKVLGLNAGADDYITKPFGNLELMARIKAVLRRAYGGQMSYEEPFVCGDLKIDYSSRKVTVRGKEVFLTMTEYRILELLARNAGKPVSKETILSKVWGWECDRDVDYVKVYMSRLRSKIEEDPAHPRYIITERGMGYMLRKQ
jgi:DNA-binding response OmpR family regulator